MKENNNIAIVLETLGEKIAALELELQCEKYRNTELEKQLVEAENKLMVYDAEKSIANMDKQIKAVQAMRFTEVE